MHKRFLPPLLAPLMLLPGCAATHLASPDPVSPSIVYQNWQIQSGTTLTSPPTGAAVLLVGALQVTGTQASATFGATALCGTPAVLSLTGTLTAGGALTLNSTPIPQEVQVSLAVPATAGGPSTGTVGALGTICALALSSPAIGTPVSSVAGTFAGTATAAGISSAYPTGTVSTVLTQAATPNASGQFPLSGTLTFTSGTCTSTTPVTGTVGGLGFSLTSATNYVSVTGGGTTSSASQLESAAITFPGGPCPASTAAVTYGGAFARQ